MFAVVFKNKVLVVFGTRPEAIKLAPVVRALDAHPVLTPVVCATGQHREMLDQVLSTFGISPDFDLDVMRQGQSPADVAARILEGMQHVYREATPDYTVVQGDTTTCFAAAVASFYHRVPVGHVEAGLRTWNMAAPFPEEGHRAMVSRVTSLHFAPTRQSARNLVREGIPAETIHVTGNTVIDALRLAQSALPTLAANDLAPLLGAEAFTRLSQSEAPVVLITGHRRENLGGQLDGVARVVRDLAAKHPDWCFVYLLHPNPEARLSPASALGGLDNVFLVEPLPYLPFIWLMTRATVLLSDSGGLQEEASELGKPMLIMRDVTERPEAVAQGGAQLVGTNGPRIFRAVESAMREAFSTEQKGHSVFGDGNAAHRIVDILWTAMTVGNREVTKVVPARRGGMQPMPADAFAQTARAAGEAS